MRLAGLTCSLCDKYVLLRGWPFGFTLYCSMPVVGMPNYPANPAPTQMQVMHCHEMNDDHQKSL